MIITTKLQMSKCIDLKLLVVGLWLLQLLQVRIALILHVLHDVKNLL